MYKTDGEILNYLWQLVETSNENGDLTDKEYSRVFDKLDAKFGSAAVKAAEKVQRDAITASLKKHGFKK